MDRRVEEEVHIPPVGLPGTLSLPNGFGAVVLFAHGSGSGRDSPRNRLVAEGLQRAGLGTLLFDLLTEEEGRDRANVFDVHLLAERLVQATRFVHALESCNGCPIGYFGASTGAAAALIAAGRAAEHDHVTAIVSRGGRPDLAEVWLDGVAAPTLLIVGGADTAVIELNQQAFARLHGVKALEIIPGAGHLFEEAGALDTVVQSAAAWFRTHLLDGR
ncbi:alpha/beta hydrolase [Azospirillum sp.]|uniref:dienelactone hydrolase family protein n=1 Tax=Azospirillum sp. TaxID=34012 RepID=UPI002D4C5213|nr:alpha/beta hydrolase [Azospirillum sp.]HYD69019.1 alpha/beta hydrolase [Azospirillum sp.]